MSTAASPAASAASPSSPPAPSTDSTTLPDHFPFATPPDVIRAAQKDEHYTASLRASIDHAAASLLGPRRYAAVSGHFDAAALLVYLWFTTGRGLQTLGEEYCDIAPATNDGHSVPRPWRRLVYLIASVFGPGMFEWYLAKQTHTPAHWRPHLRWAVRHAMLPLHLATFYFSGAYYSLAKRVAGLRSLSVSRPPPGAQTMSYTPLGVVVLLQVCAAVGVAGYRAMRARRVPVRPAAPRAGGTYVAVAREECVLCMTPRQDTAVAPCGHAFCWACICDWLREKSECALCRAPCVHQDLICVDY